MKAKSEMQRWQSADARAKAPDLATARVARAMGHGSATARVTRATCKFVLFAIVGALWSAGALAQQAGQTQDAPAAVSRPFGAPSVTTSAAPSGIASLGQVTLALGLVLALIFVAAWLMRRLRGFGKTGTGTLDIVADLAVGQKERAVLIRVGTQQVLIGVAPGRVTTLHVLTEPVSVAPATGGNTPSGPGSTAPPTFKSLLLKSLGK
jgi:flagellar protein FliO/FliZ